MARSALLTAATVSVQGLAAAAFVREAAPRATPVQRRFAAELVGLTLMSVGKQLSEQSRAAAEVERFADASARMLMHHLTSLGPS